MGDRIDRGKRPLSLENPVAQGSTHPSLLSRVRDPADGGAWREFESQYGPLILEAIPKPGQSLF